MASGSDDILHMMDERSARSNRGRKTVSRGLLRTTEQTEVEANPPAALSKANL
ncbi:unnamed protein product [Protopolystoma xenopodis]|uniref:Uncharacterized protein n=1 Tax=Protopolystoma xenopodis TaxID=117903 RepID=A0A448X0I1_9PLAT|nr:unnamed protein product [Protopolystoma xenopodis]